MPTEMLLQILQQLPGENDGIPVMSPSAIATADMTVLERQLALLQWQQQQKQQQLQSHPQQQPTYFAATTAVSDTSHCPTPYSIPQPPHILPSSTVSLHATDFCGELQGMMIDHDLPSGSVGVWPDLAHYPLLCNSVPGSAVAGGAGEAMSGVLSCLPFVDKVESGRRLSPPPSQLEHAPTMQDGAAVAAAVPALSTERARQCSKKRKSTERAGTTKLEENEKAKKMIKVENTDSLVIPNVESPSIMSSSPAITTNNCKDNNRETSSSPSKEKPKVPEPPPKTEYIHVRARRGQATDSHSLAERVRREKISERMKLLQDLVPGCNKTTGKAGMLDEIINYVQSLQRQVEFLSMKLAVVTPALDFDLDALITDELLGLSFLQLNPLQQEAMAAEAAAAAECGGRPVPMVASCTPAEVALHGIATAPVSTTTESCSFPDSCNNVLVHLPPTKPAWDGDLQRFYSSMEEYEQGTTPAASVPAGAAV